MRKEIKTGVYNRIQQVSQYSLIVLSITFFLMLSGKQLLAQDTTYLLTSAMITKDGYLDLPKTSKWRFKEGNDITWASSSFDHSQWEKLDSIAIDNIRVDENGLFEGWFVISIKLDSSLANIPFHLKFHNGSPSDIYINGNFIQSFGNTDYKTENYRGVLNSDLLQSISLPVNQKLFIALHFVEYQEILYRLGNPTAVIRQDLLSLLNNDAFQLIQERNSRQETIFYSFGFANLVFIILFWLIALLNRSQAHLISIAVVVSLLFLVYSNGDLLDRGIVQSLTSNIAAISNYFQPPLIILLFVSFLYLFTSILEVIFSRWIKLTIIIFIAVSFVIQYLPLEFSRFYFIITILFVLITGLYYLIRFRRNFKGSKNIVLIGPLLMLALVIIQIISISLFDIVFLEDYVYLIFMIIPLNLLFYIAFWLKEMMKNIEVKAQELVMISNEKKEILQNQNIVLEQQVLERTEKLNLSLENLKATQSQLIQSEKMASLGELTAGIAHEIQNPLNFVNNFSEVSTELVDDLQTEIEKGNTTDAKEIANDLKQNLEKINHHGKRASDIVKGMLQHSRNNGGKKEPTDINALCDEYLRLAYHGLRAKDKSFNAIMKTSFDTSIGSVNIITQDIGRVILNLITNAFHAVDEKVKTDSTAAKANQYEPTVTVQTKKEGQDLLISVMDNGNGIPKAILDKIFNPFFTTKPAGKGTGLGLSLSYDIVKAHGGEIKVTTKEGMGTEFIVVLKT